MNKKHILLVTYLLLALYGLAKNTNLSFYNKILLDENKSIFKANKGVGYYSSEGELLFVSNKNNLKTKIKSHHQDGIYVRKEKNLEIILLSNIEDAVLSGSSLDEIRENIHFNSLLLLVLILVVLILFFFTGMGIKLFTFKSGLEINLIKVIPIIVITSVMLSFLFTNNIFGVYFILFSILLLYRLVIGFFFDKYLKTECIYTRQFYFIFNFSSILFVLFLGLKITSYQNINISTWLEQYFLIFILIFSSFSFHSVFKSTKKVKLNYLFYYFCALEILPILFLKEYYIS